MVNTKHKISIRGIAKDAQLRPMGKIKTKLIFDDKSSQHEFYILNENFNLRTDAIIGHNSLQALNVKIDYFNKTLEIQLPTHSERQTINKSDGDISKISSFKINKINENHVATNKFIGGFEKISSIKMMQSVNDKKHVPQSPKIKGKRNSNKHFFDNMPSKHFEGYDVKAMNKIEIDEKFQPGISNSCIQGKIFKANVSTDDETEITDVNERKELLFQRFKKDNLNENEIEEISRICNEFPNVFYLPGDVLKPTDVGIHEIRLKSNIPPIYIKQYRTAEKHRAIINSHIQDLLKRGVIEPSVSPWNFPILLVNKKLDDGINRIEKTASSRMVIDSRALNEQCVKEDAPIFLIDDLLDQIKPKHKYFTKVDVFSAYHMIALHANSKQYVAFNDGFSKYQFTRAPFGLAGSGFSWIRAINEILKDEINRNCVVYIDDILLFSEDFDSHIH